MWFLFAIVCASSVAFSNVYGLSTLLSLDHHFPVCVLTLLTHQTCTALQAVQPCLWYLLQLSEATFNWVLKVIQNCTGFALLCVVIGLGNLQHPLNQSDAKLKPILTCSLVFSCAWGQLLVSTLSSHWLLVISVYFEFSLAACDVNVCSDWAFVITLVLILQHSIEKRSNVTTMPTENNLHYSLHFIVSPMLKGSLSYFCLLAQYCSTLRQVFEILIKW